MLWNFNSATCDLNNPTAVTRRRNCDANACFIVHCLGLEVTLEDFRYLFADVRLPVPDLSMDDVLQASLTLNVHNDGKHRIWLSHLLHLTEVRSLPITFTGSLVNVSSFFSSGLCEWIVQLEYSPVI